MPLLVPVALLALAAPPITAQVVPSDSLAGSEIRTSATAERSVRPDRATVTLSFSAPGRTPAVAGTTVAHDPIEVQLRELTLVGRVIDIARSEPRPIHAREK